MSVINGATCNATVTSGCGQTPPAVTTGAGAGFAGIDEALHTLFTPNGATCNGSHTAGCKGHMRTVGVGRSPYGVAVDLRTNIVYAADLFSAAVSVLNGARCNAVTSGCRHAVHQQAAGSLPQDVIVNQRTSTVYVTQVFLAGSMSILSATQH